MWLPGFFSFCPGGGGRRRWCKTTHTERPRPLVKAPNKRLAGPNLCNKQLFLRSIGNWERGWAETTVPTEAERVAGRSDRARPPFFRAEPGCGVVVTQLVVIMFFLLFPFPVLPLFVSL